MAGTVAVVPVRGSSSAKTRLAPLLTEDERLALVWVMLRRLVHEIGASGTVDGTVVVTRDPEAVARHLPTAPHLSILHQSDVEGLNPGLELARDWVLNRGYDVMLVLPGDLPIISAGDIRALSTVEGTLVVVPDRGEGGTNALRIDLRHRDAPAFRFRMGPASFSHHLDDAARMGGPVRALSLAGIAHDLDSPRDWADLSSDRQRQLLEAMHESLIAAGHLA